MKKILYLGLLFLLFPFCKPASTSDSIVPDDHFCKTIASPVSADRAVGVRGKYWDVGQTLRFKLLDGTAQQRAYLTNAVTESQKYVNLKVVYVTSGDADIRVSFVSGGGSWSYIGRDALSVPQTYATMNLGWLGSDVAMHELFHAYGAAHEQSSPNSDINWNKPVVYAALGGPPNNWPPATVDFNVFRKMTAVEAEATVFDPASIMQYPVPGSWTFNYPNGIAGGKVLSAKDIEFWSAKYPYPVPPTGTVTITTAQKNNLKRLVSKAKALTDAAKIANDSVALVTSALFGTLNDIQVSASGGTSNTTPIIVYPPFPCVKCPCPKVDCPPVVPCPVCPVVPPKDTIKPVPPTPPITPVKGGEFFLGINSNHFQDKSKQEQFTGIRLYLPIGWAWTEKGFYGQPLKQAQKQFLGVDDYLRYMKSKNVDVLLTLMASPDYLSGHTEGIGTTEWPPIRPGRDHLDPKSWSEVASIYKAFAIRYGSVKFPKGSYRIDPAGPRWNGDSLQTELSGLNLVTYIAVGNEPDAWWAPERYLGPEEYATMLMVCWDSIKSADPKLKVAMAGLTNADYRYLERMNAKFISMGRGFLSDVIDIHRYANSGNLPGVHPPTWLPNQATSVEQDPGIADITRVVEFAKLVGKPAFISEFGWDTRPGTQMSPPSDLEQTQAQWLTRAVLEYTRLGIERTYIFTLADEPNPDAGLFTSSGVLYGESRGYAPKPSFLALTGMKKELQGMRFTRDLSTASVRIMQYEGSGITKLAFWSPNGSTFQSPVNGVARNVTGFPQFVVK